MGLCVTVAEPAGAWSAQGMAGVGSVQAMPGMCAPRHRDCILFTGISSNWGKQEVKMYAGSFERFLRMSV